MSAAELRQAAETLRAKATASFDASDSTQWWTDEGLSEAMYSMDDISMTGVEEDAAYLSLFHPSVGLALADLLDFAAETAQGWERIGNFDPSGWPEPTRLAHVLARLINGSPS